MFSRAKASMPAAPRYFAWGCFRYFGFGGRHGGSRTFTEADIVRADFRPRVWEASCAEGNAAQVFGAKSWRSINRLQRLIFAAREATLAPGCRAERALRIRLSGGYAWRTIRYTI